MARRLGREYDPWARAVACLVKATAENAAGDCRAALAALRAGLEKATATNSIVYAMAARYRLGQMLGGSEGRAMSEAAIADMIARGAPNPERWLQLQLPGKWSAGA